MEEHTSMRRRKGGVYDGVIEEQRTITGGVRTYITCLRFISEGEDLGDEVYRFKIPIAYLDPTKVSGALTPTIAGWRIRDAQVLLAGGGLSAECYKRNQTFERNQAVVDVWIKTSNVEVVAINIEGRIVEGKVPL